MLRFGWQANGGAIAPPPPLGYVPELGNAPRKLMQLKHITYRGLGTNP